MTTTLLHYIHDPLCGWCYGAAPLVAAARAIVTVRAHGGGMMSGASRQAVTPQLRAYVMPHDARIAEASGQPFGERYVEGLLRDCEAVFDSEPPTAAMLAADALAGRGLDLLARLQRAHYVEGRRIAERAVLVDLAAEIGLDAGGFAQALDVQMGAPVQAHFRDTWALMSQVGARGFPSFVLESEGVRRPVDLARLMGRPQDVRGWLLGQMPSAAPDSALRTADSAPAPSALVCDAQGCAL